MQSSIDILIPAASAFIGAWYEDTAAAADGMPPHITLLWPWLDAPVSEQRFEGVGIAVRGIKPFALSFVTCGRFPGVLYLNPVPREPLIELIGRLMGFYPDNLPYGGAFGIPQPHLTVTKSQDEEVLNAAQRTIEAKLATSPLFCVIDRVSISEEGLGHDGAWAVRHEVLLE